MLKKAVLNIHNRLIGGIFVIVPFVVTIAVVRWLFLNLAEALRPVVVKVINSLMDTHIIQQWPEVYVRYTILVATLICLLVCIYPVGAIAGIVAVRRVIAAGENLLIKIPLAGPIYTATRQIMNVISRPENKTIISVVLVEFPRPGFHSIGFLTGRIKNTDSTTFCKVFIPTAPNFTSGYFVLAPHQNIVETSLPMEETFKMIISGGIISPKVIHTIKRIT